MIIWALLCRAWVWKPPKRARVNGTLTPSRAIQRGQFPAAPVRRGLKLALQRSQMSICFLSAAAREAAAKRPSLEARCGPPLPDRAVTKPHYGRIRTEPILDPLPTGRPVRVPGLGVALATGAGDFEAHLLSPGLAVLRFERRGGRHPALGAEAAGVDQVAVLAAEDRQVEVADRGVGDDRDGRLSAVPSPSGFGVGARTSLTWPSRMKARRGRPPEPETA